MRQHKTVALVIRIRSIVNFVLSAPAVREIHEARDDVIIRVLAEDVGTVAEKRRFWWKTSPEDPTQSDSDSEDGYETAPDESPGRSTSSVTFNPSQITKEPPPKIMTPKVIKATKIIAAAGLFTAAIGGLVAFQYSFTNSSASGS